MNPLSIKLENGCEANILISSGNKSQLFANEKLPTRFGNYNLGYIPFYCARRWYWEDFHKKAYFDLYDRNSSSTIVIDTIEHVFPICDIDTRLYYYSQFHKIAKRFVNFKGWNNINIFVQ